jgi:hypothetical protein
VGLAGEPLKWKMGGYETARAEFEQAKQQHGLFSGLIKKPLKKLLQWMNLILGSLVAAMPALEPIKEIKEAVELSLEE